MKITGYIFLILLIISGCMKTELNVSGTDYINGLKNAASEIVVTDGIDELEAAILAEIYFFSYVSACGVVGQTSDHSSYWETDVYVGYAATKLEPIKINKKTGKMSWARGPTIDDPVRHFTAEPSRQD